MKGLTITNYFLKHRQFFSGYRKVDSVWTLEDRYICLLSGKSTRKFPAQVSDMFLIFVELLHINFMLRSRTSIGIFIEVDHSGLLFVLQSMASFGGDLVCLCMHELFLGLL